MSDIQDEKFEKNLKIQKAISLQEQILLIAEVLAEYIEAKEVKSEVEEKAIDTFNNIKNLIKQ